MSFEGEGVSTSRHLYAFPVDFSEPSIPTLNLLPNEAPLERQEWRGNSNIGSDEGPTSTFDLQDGHRKVRDDFPLPPFRKVSSPPMAGERIEGGGMASRSAIGSREVDSGARKRRSKDADVGIKPRKQLTPLKIRPTAGPSFAQLPATPMTAYFDASPYEEGTEEGKSLVPTSSGPTVQSGESADSQPTLLGTSPALSSDGVSVDENGTEGSAGGFSLSSEIDTPGPITPATPAWKPRELTLLQTKHSFDSSGDSSHRAEREKGLVGLGVQTPSLSSLSEERRVSRLQAKDIFPIVNASHPKPPSPNLNSSVPRALKLASSGGPPKFGRGNRSSSRGSPSPILSLAVKTSVPVLPPGPAFSSSPHLAASTSSEASSSERDGSSFDSLTKSSPSPTHQQAASELPIRSNVINDDDLTPMNRSRKGSPLGAANPIVSTGQSGAGPKRKAAPAPLILAYSPASSYSHDSGIGSVQTSTGSPLPTPQSSQFLEQVHSGLLAIPNAQGQSREVPISPMSPFGGQSFHTPLQSPMQPSDSILGGSLPNEAGTGKEDSAAGVLSEPEEIPIEGKGKDRARVLDGRAESDGSEEAAPAMSQHPYEPSDAFEFETPAPSTSNHGMPESIGEEEARERGSQDSSGEAPSELRLCSPTPAITFKTDIFTSTQVKRKSTGSERQRATLQFQSEPSSTAPPLSSPLPASALAGAGRRERRASSLRRQSHSPMGPPPSLPLPTLPMPSSITPATQSPRAKPVESFLRKNSMARAKGEPASAGEQTGRHQEQDVLRASRPTEKPQPVLPKSKASLVPDVPSFGYTGPINRAEVAETFSPAISTGFSTPFLDNEPESTSRWSSGSDSEEERSQPKSTPKKSVKQRKSFSGMSGQSSKKNSLQAGAAGAAVTPKKANFFAGLGLRKKSVPNLSHWSTSPQSTSVGPPTTSSDSPAPGKLDGLVEFPFPSTTASQRQSLTSTSRRGSVSPLPPTAASPGLGEAPSVRVSARISQSRVTNPGQSSSRLSLGQSRKLTPRPSDASIRTTASSQAVSGSSALARYSSTSASPAMQSPVLERRPSAPWDEGVDVQGLGIQMPGQEEGSGDSTLRDTYEALQKSLRTAKSNESIRVAKQAMASYRNSQESAALGNLLARKERGQQEEGGKQGEKVAGRKRSLTLQSFGGVVGEKGKQTSRPTSGTMSPWKALSSPSDSTFSSLNSPDETPRVAYASLSGQEYSYVDHPKLKHKIERKGTAEDEEDLVALGQAFLTSINVSSPPAPPATALPTDAKTKEGEGQRVRKRVRVTRAGPRPRYPSLTDVGREWKREHSGDAFGGACGEELLFNVLAGGKETSGGRIIKTTSFSDESDSGTDDYGSSDGAGAGGQGSGPGDGSGAGRGDDRGRDEDKRSNERKQWVAATDQTDSGSSESEDSYGASDNELPFGQLSTAKRGASRLSSSSSDDVPLGQKVQNPNELQRQLRRMQSKASQKQKGGAGAVKKEVASSKLFPVLDADDLTARLIKVQLEREAGPGRGGEVAAPMRELNMPHSSSLSRSRSISSRKPPSSSAQARTRLPPLPIRAETMPMSESSQSSDQVMTKTMAERGAMASQLSSSISPSNRQPRLHLNTSSGGHSASTDGTMVTAQEMPATSSQGHGEDYRSNVVADFANTIRARSRSRSMAQPFAPPLDANRPALPIRTALTSQGSKVTGATVSPSVPSTAPASETPFSPITRSSNNGSTISPREPSTSRTMKSSSSAEDQEPISRVRSTTGPTGSSTLVQHRVYLLNKQRCGTAEVGMNARARDVVHSIMEREPMPADSRVGGWVVYDVCAELGIERPIREYEVLSDVIANRTSAQSDYFLLKRTELAPYLSAKNVPNSSAALAGWVYVQDNHRKRWNKRWLELRDNCIFQAKTEKGKEEGLVCSLSSFDLYLVESSKVKTPKQHSFALRSQTSINLFESPEADYVHFFSLSDGAAARHWITAIINARTFVLRQERSHLFRAPSTAGPAPAPSSTLPEVAAAPLEQMARRQRIPLDSSSSPSHNNAANMAFGGGGSGPGSSPLLSFPQSSYPKGSLMEERFTRSAVAAGEAGVPQRESAMERLRREEVQYAERKGKKEGKPLIGIIPDIRTAGMSSRP